MDNSAISQFFLTKVFIIDAAMINPQVKFLRKQVSPNRLKPNLIIQEQLVKLLQSTLNVIFLLRFSFMDKKILQ